MYKMRVLFNKIIVIGILILLIGVGIIPTISGIKNSNEEFSTIIFYTFDKTGTRKCKMELPMGVIEDISCLFESVKKGITSDPFSFETESLKNDFVEFLDLYNVIPRGLSKDDVLSLLEPRWNRNSGGNSPLINSRESLFRNSVLPGPFAHTGSSFFCSMAGGGSGVLFSPIMMPRPRLATVWSAYLDDTISIASNLYTGHGFAAMGSQLGIALGFWGIGLSFAIPGEPAIFGFGGYALAAFVGADDVETYPPNQVPVITDEQPSDGSVDVPTGLSELSFRISDGDGDRMSYTVTTSPDIGSGSGSNVVGGVYSVPVSGLNSDTEYSWHVVVSDAEDINEETFSFRTAKEAPFVSDPNPVDGDDWVSVNISELSFRLEDFQGDLMDFSVKTVPDIGSGSGSDVGDGVYSVDVSGLEYTRDYSWFVNVTDGEFWTRRVFNFRTQPLMVFDPFDDGWNFRKKITVNHSMVAGDLSDFPVLISLIDSDLASKAQVDGDDVLFMDGSGVADRLFHEIEFFDGSSGELVCWVNVHSLSSVDDTILYLYYGNPDCSNQEFPEYVWDSNYVSVWHMSGNSYTEFEDSTSNSFDATNDVGNPSYQQSSKIGYGVEFDGIDDMILICDDDKFSFCDSSCDKPCSFEAWINTNKQGYVISKFVQGSTGEWILQVTGVEKCRLYFKDSVGDARMDRYSNSEVTDNNWYYLSATFNGGNDYRKMIFYINGVDDSGDGVRLPNYNHMRNKNEIVRFGGRPNEDRYFDGLIDEVRISNVERSSSWITTSYNTMNDPSSFLSIGSEESAP